MISMTDMKVQEDPLLPTNGVALEIIELGNESSALENGKNGMLYGVEDSPPWPTKLFMGFQVGFSTKDLVKYGEAFQQLMVAVGGAIVLPIMVADLICAEADESAKLKFIGTTLTMTGVATIMQTALGCRLPLLQGPSFAFIPPVIAMMKLEEMRCPAISATTFNATIEEGQEPWRTRMQIVQGGLIGASLIQMLLGLTGLVGVLVRYVGPLTIAPLMLLIEISVAKEVLRQMEMHWISLAALFSLALFLLYLPRVQVPFPYYDMKKKKIVITRAPLFGLFPFLMSIGLVWLLAVLLTVTFFNDDDIHARTDTKSSEIANAPWLRIPYPGQWGVPIFNFGVFLGMVGGTIASVVESVGDYQACARVCGERTPPSHAVNRGIFIEGVSCFVTGFFGGTVSLTTFSQNIGVIGSTRVASRSMMLIAGVMFIFLGFFTKFAAILSTLPTPIIGSILGVSLSIVGGVGLSSIKLIDAGSSRNIAILGLSIMSGMVIPMYVAEHPIETGSEAVDQMLQIVLSIEMLVGGIIGFTLDNTVPGTRAERGLATEEVEDCSKTDSLYGFSDGIMNRLRLCPLITYLPILPRLSTTND